MVAQFHLVGCVGQASEVTYGGFMRDNMFMVEPY